MIKATTPASAADGSIARARLLTGLEASDGQLAVAGVATRVIEAGSGPPLLLLHGGIECGAVYWAPVIAGLAQHHRVIAPDLPGLGESQPLGRLDPESFAAWLDAFVASRCEERPILVAHSLVGGLSVRFGIERGGCLRRLVVYGGPAIGPYRMPLGLRAVAVRFALHPTRRNSERFERFALLDRDSTRRLDPDWFDAWAAYTRSRARVPHVKRAMRQLVRSGTRRIADDELRRAETVSLVWGRADRMVEIELANRASALFGWPLFIVEHAGHVPHLEQPHRFLEALAGALRRQRERVAASASEGVGG